MTVSGSGRRVTVRLRPGVRWHDGRALTARDVAFTFRRLEQRFHPRFTPQLAAVARVRAPDARTVIFDLKHPSLGFADQPLADVPILPRHLWSDLPPDRLAPRGRPVGSGPYRLVAHRRGDLYRFRANRRYFLGRPAPARIDVPVIRDAEETFRAFERGAADVVAVSLPQRERARLDDLGSEIMRGASYSGTVLMFNVRRAPFDRAAVRRAVAAAIDPRRIARAITGAVAADRGYLHPSSRWAPRARVRAPAPRPALRASGLAPVTVLASDADPVRLEAGRQVVLALRRAGVRASLRELAPRALAAAVGQDRSDPDFQAAIWSSPPLASHDPDFLRAVFGAGMPLNYSGFRDERFARLADRVAGAPTRAARRAAVVEQLGLLAREAPVVPLVFEEGAFAFRRAAHDGWVFVTGSGILDKRSFLGGGAPAPPRAAAGGEGAPAGSATPGVLGWAAAVLAAAAVLLVVLASRRRRG